MRWTIHQKPDKNKIDNLQKALQVDPIIATLLVQRGIETYDQAKSFFRPSLSDLHNPFLMKDMQKAVDRIEKAIQEKQKILVFGDYDVDGTTAVSLVASYLKSYYPNISTYIPDRYNEGYGISYQSIDFAQQNQIALIIALDCGIKSIDHVLYANKKGIDFIIADHHRPGDIVPEAVAILNPKQEDCLYPYKELCGCGVGFKLIQALAKNNNQTIQDLVQYLDLVATAIGADIVPITGENRVLAKFGLEVINTRPRPGIQALIENRKNPILTITDVVFGVAPRINAAGRIKHGNYAVALLSEFNLEQARLFASEIEIFNNNRKLLDQQITKEALQQIKDDKQTNNYSTVVYQEDWHKGVIGIVASRLIETHYKPTIVFTKSNDKLAASARSVKDFDIYNALEASSEFLEQFGGHMYAAGMTLKPENYIAFKNKFEQVVQQTIPQSALVPEITIHTAIDFTEITDKLIRILKQFEPFGPQNDAPVFITKNVYDTGFAKPIGQNNDHLRAYLKQNNSPSFAAIGFGIGSKINYLKQNAKVAIVFSVQESHWQQSTTIQLRLRDIKPNDDDDN